MKKPIINSKLDELGKYQAVNRCESASELEIAMRLISDDSLTIKGLTKTFDLKKSIWYMYKFIDDENGVVPPNVLTRAYGIRQQAMYIKYYKE